MGIPVARWLAWYLPSTVVCDWLGTYYDSYQHEILHHNHQCKKGDAKVATASYLQSGS